MERGNEFTGDEVSHHVDVDIYEDSDTDMGMYYALKDE